MGAHIFHDVANFRIGQFGKFFYGEILLQYLDFLNSIRFQFGGSEAIITALSDEFPKIGRNRELFVGCLFSLYFVVGK